LISWPFSCSRTRPDYPPDRPLRKTSVKEYALEAGGLRSISDEGAIPYRPPSRGASPCRWDGPGPIGVPSQAFLQRKSRPRQGPAGGRPAVADRLRRADRPPRGGQPLSSADRASSEGVVP